MLISPAIYATSPPPASAARSQPPFRLPDGTFDQAGWNRQNYPALLDGYFAQPDKVAMYLVSGDHDRYGIAFETALFYKVMLEKQAA